MQLLMTPNLLDGLSGEMATSNESELKPTATNYYGLNLGPRAQSTAPETTWQYHDQKLIIPSTSRLSGRFFEKNNDDEKEVLMDLRRPSSTGVIGRRRSGNKSLDDGDVDNILSTLGLLPLENVGQGSIKSGRMSSSLGGITSPAKNMEKINEGSSSSLGDAMLFSGGGQLGLQRPNLMQLTQPQVLSGQYFEQQKPVFQQQQAYHYPLAQDYNTQDCGGNMNRGHGGSNLQMNITNQQQATYPNHSYGYDYQTAQPPPHVQHILLNQLQEMGGGVNAQQMLGGIQPQLISIVPIHAPHDGSLHQQQQYAYVHYGNMTSPLPLVNASSLGGRGPPGGPNMASTVTYIMSPNGPIAISSVGGDVGGTPGLAPIHVENYAGMVEHHYLQSSSPRDRINGIGGSNQRSPDRTNGGGVGGNKKHNTNSSMSSPRGLKGQQGRGGGAADKNASTTSSRLGPEATYILNEIRAAKSRTHWTIQDIRGHVVEFCLDQNGSRFIQQRLEVADPAEKQAVMDEIIPAIKELQNDVFGNYVIQKLYELGTPSIKKELKGTLKGNMFSLCLQMYGCRVIQKAMESLDYEDLCELILEFDSNVLTCITDQNGNHVMQKCIEIMSAKAKEAEYTSGNISLSKSITHRIQFIVDEVLSNVRHLCCHPYGCRILQRMLEHCVESQKSATLDEIQRCHKALLDDQYGNYVIQHVLQYGRESDRDSLLHIIVHNDLLKLSRQKFASNVVEKLLKYGNSNQRNAIVREMLHYVESVGPEGTGGSSVVLLMVRDAYANYVVQTAIDVVPEGNEKRMLIEELKANEIQLVRNFCAATAASFDIIVAILF